MRLEASLKQITVGFKKKLVFWYSSDSDQHSLIPHSRAVRSFGGAKRQRTAVLKRSIRNPVYPKPKPSETLNSSDPQGTVTMFRHVMISVSLVRAKTKHRHQYGLFQTSQRHCMSPMCAPSLVHMVTSRCNIVFNCNRRLPTHVVILCID